MNIENFFSYFLIIVFLLIFTFRKLNFFRDLKGLFLSKKRKTELDQFYKRYFNYYNLLSEKDKQRFIYRANNLIYNVKIIGRQGFIITEQVKLYVVAAQVQLTFGLGYYYLPVFKVIYIYPSSYKNRITGNMHDGEINPRGLIALSWEKFTKGYLNPSDGINLGLHELAHALMFSILKTDRHDMGLDESLNKILKLSTSEIKKIRNRESHLFREYAGENTFEFFAIAVEQFFENPQGLISEMPTLYAYLSKLLNQDPIKNKYR